MVCAVSHVVDSSTARVSALRHLVALLLLVAFRANLCKSSWRIKPSQDLSASAAHLPGLCFYLPQEARGRSAVLCKGRHSLSFSGLSADSVFLTRQHHEGLPLYHQLALFQQVPVPACSTC